MFQKEMKLVHKQIGIQKNFSIVENAFSIIIGWCGTFLCVSNEAKVLLGWKIQLITWIVICWEWQDNKNLIMENWSEIGILKTRVQCTFIASDPSAFFGRRWQKQDHEDDRDQL